MGSDEMFGPFTGSMFRAFSSGGGAASIAVFTDAAAGNSSVG